MNDLNHTDDPHRGIEELLPWYVTGQLDQADRERVERHLSGCARCELQLRLERRLADKWRDVAPDVEIGWQRLRAQIETPLEPPPARRNRTASLAARAWRASRRPGVAALIAAQLALLAFTGGLATYLSRPQPGAYQVLGSAPAAADANVVVMFRPDAREAELRRLLNANGASLVGGPTAADAYLLHVPAEARTGALARLRTRPEIVMAQPIDGEIK
jgi:anti-sigma factor RsiW